VDENDLLPEKQDLWRVNVADITDLAGLEEVDELGSSRFGLTKLLKRSIDGGDFEFFAAKFYNAGDNREGSQAFEDLVNPFVALSHPHVMPIVGVIPPTQGRGPIVITRYSEWGSLSDVLDRVSRHDPPPLWNSEATLRPILGLLRFSLFEQQ
jgi:hypothetical protein